MTTTTRTHIITDDSHGSDCTCGRRFTVETRYGMDALRGANLAHANARRHAKAANAKAAK